PLQMTLARPSIVVLCVGAADFARREATVVAALRGRSAPFELRPRLLGWLARLLGPGSEPSGAESDGFLGEWHFGDALFAFDPDGLLRMGDVQASWSCEGGRLE